MRPAFPLPTRYRMCAFNSDRSARTVFSKSVIRNMPPSLERYVHVQHGGEARITSGAVVRAQVPRLRARGAWDGEDAVIEASDQVAIVLQTPSAIAAPHLDAAASDRVRAGIDHHRRAAD